MKELLLASFPALANITTRGSNECLDGAILFFIAKLPVVKRQKFCEMLNAEVAAYVRYADENKIVFPEKIDPSKKYLFEGDFIPGEEQMLERVGQKIEELKRSAPAQETLQTPNSATLPNPQNHFGAMETFEEATLIEEVDDYANLSVTMMEEAQMAEEGHFLVGEDEGHVVTSSMGIFEEDVPNEPSEQEDCVDFSDAEAISGLFYKVATEEDSPLELEEVQ